MERPRGVTAATEKPLEERARRFAAHYRGRGTGSTAARAAGYEGNNRTIAVTAHRLVHDPRVLTEMERVRGEGIRARARTETTEATPNDIGSPLPRLRAQHAAFVEAWAECGTYAEAASRAGYSGGAAKLRKTGARVARRPDVAAHLAAVRMRIEANAIADRNELEAILTAIARDGEERSRDRIAAVRELLKAQGHVGPGLGAFRAGGGPVLPEIPSSSSGAAVIVWRGNGRGPAPDET